MQPKQMYMLAYKDIVLYRFIIIIVNIVIRTTYFFVPVFGTYNLSMLYLYINECMSVSDWLYMYSFYGSFTLIARKCLKWFFLGVCLWVVILYPLEWGGLVSSVSEEVDGLIWNHKIPVDWTIFQTINDWLDVESSGYSCLLHELKGLIVLVFSHKHLQLTLANGI